MESKESKGGKKFKKATTAASSFVNSIAKKLVPKRKQETETLESPPSKKRLANIFSKKSKSSLKQDQSKPGKPIIKSQAATTSGKKQKKGAPDKKAANTKPVLYVTTTHHRTAGGTTRPTHKPTHMQNYTVERVSISNRMIPQRIMVLNQSKLSTAEDESNGSANEQSKSNIQVISSDENKNIIELVKSSSIQKEKESNEAVMVEKDLVPNESSPASEYHSIKIEEMLPGRSEHETNEADARTTPANSQVNLAHELVKHVDTLKKISLIADELNQKTAKSLKDIVNSVKGDLMQKLEEINLESQAAATTPSVPIVAPMKEEIISAPEEA